MKKTLLISVFALFCFAEFSFCKKEKIENASQSLKTIENKYQLMATQFAAYGNIINQMEASFSGFKMLIESSNRKN